jgi:hypothetical protein
LFLSMLAPYLHVAVVRWRRSRLTSS